MAAVRSSKTLVSRRRRARRNSEDDDSVTMVEDSQSEGSAPSDPEDGDADGSEMSETDQKERKVVDETGISSNGIEKRPVKGPKKAVKPDEPKEFDQTTSSSEPQKTVASSTDTEAMVIGLQISEDAGEGSAVNFEDMITNEPSSKPADTPTLEPQASLGKSETLFERRKREHDEYKKKRDSDPTFIPNRGNFFMHDARAQDQRGFTSYGRGRGRGRGFVGGPFSPAGQMLNSVDKTANAPWAHDLHDTLDEPNSKPRTPATIRNEGVVTSQNSELITRPDPAGTTPPLNFSTSKLLGNVQIRVLLPGMKEAVPFAAVPFKQHTRLPNHRPPLRRDKPVRVSLPDRLPRYIFPSQDRSFIFIPRAMRPNQQGFGRARGSFGYGGPSSRRTSIYGGSMYSPSVALSRRSSLAQDVAREAMFSPTGSMARGVPGPGRPVVRLPQGMQYQTSVGSPAGSAFGGAPQTYPLPQKPTHERHREDATMHQPRPQKTISVSGIESPAGLSLHAPQQQSQQPFENQLPQHMAEGSQPLVEGAPPPHYSYGGQMASGTPLSNIPERAIHAQPFQPPNAAYGPGFYGQYPQGYYYPPPHQPQYQPIPVFVPQATGSNESQADLSNEAAGQSTAGLVAHESNGMVYYIEPGQMGQYPQQQDGLLQPGSFAIPGMGGMMTPGPEYYYPQGAANGAMFYSQAQ